MRSEEAARSELGAPGAATLGWEKGGGPGGGLENWKEDPLASRGKRVAHRRSRRSGSEDKGVDTRALQVVWSGCGTARPHLALAHRGVLNERAPAPRRWRCGTRDVTSPALDPRHPLTPLNTCRPTSGQEQCLALPGWIPQRGKLNLSSLRRHPR